jgi:hypothetical protein
MKRYENQTIHPLLRSYQLGGGCNDFSNYTGIRHGSGAI